MKFLLLIFLIFPIIASAQFMTEDELIKANNLQPYTAHQISIEQCELETGKTCYDMEGLIAEYHYVNFLGFLAEDSSLKTQYSIVELAKTQKLKDSIDRIKRLNNSVANFNSLNSAQKDNLLKDLINQILEK